MPQAKLIRPSEVKAFQAIPGYLSKMLLDNRNSDSQALHLNQGILSAGAAMPGGDHRPPYDEIYIIQQGSCALQVGEEHYQVTVGDIVYIPGGTYHRLDNTAGAEDLVLLTVWPGTPPVGVNPVYDNRVKAWGKSYRLEADE
jgi:mannose-6-phosphate isomerase-like protein (cupin superfamily)